MAITGTSSRGATSSHEVSYLLALMKLAIVSVGSRKKMVAMEIIGRMIVLERRNNEDYLKNVS